LTIYIVVFCIALAREPHPMNRFILRSHCPSAVLLAIFSLALGVSATAQVPTDADAYRAEIERWHQKRIESLKNPEGYLSLVGLFPLVEGESRFGSDADNDLVFPAGSPGRAGVFVLEDGEVRVEVAEGVIVTAGDAAVTSAVLKSDAEGKPTLLAMGSMRFYVIDRSGHVYIRLKDVESELIDHFDGIDRYPVEAEWRIEARFEPYDPPKPIRITDVLGTESVQDCPGRLVFEVDGVPCSLEPMSASKGRLFIVFGDGTSGLETYGGGRFLYAEPPSDAGAVVLDFNRAYNPPCAFSPFATCPLPHEANRLTVRITAGEKNLGEGH
jgi:uncharacterized protein (DUF1684 family)